LHMIRISRISRLQADLDQIIQVGSEVKRENSIPPPVEAPKANTMISTSSPLSKFKPTLAEVKTASTNNENNNSVEKEGFKDRLDQLVRNW
jgi:chromatin remodeling complex protein RSC6